MTNELLISECLFAIIILIGLFVVREFYVAKNGILRKLMIWYFSIDVYVYVLSALYWWLAEQGWELMPVYGLRLAVLIPKAIIKLRILYYLRTKK